MIAQLTPLPGNSRLPRLRLLALLALPLHACIPITVKAEHVEPSIHTETMAQGWDPVVGPYVRMDFVHQFKQALREQSDRVDFLDPESFWQFLFHERKPPSTAPVSTVLAAIQTDKMDSAKPDFLVILGEPKAQSTTTSSHGVEPFYAEVLRTNSTDAVLISLRDGSSEKKLHSVRAEGTEKSGWAPASILLFMRFFKTVDTESSAMSGLARSISGDIELRGNASSVHIAVLATQSGTWFSHSTTAPGLIPLEHGSAMPAPSDEIIVNCVSEGERRWVTQSKCD